MGGRTGSPSACPTEFHHGGHRGQGDRSRKVNREGREGTRRGSCWIACVLPFCSSVLCASVTSVVHRAVFACFASFAVILKASLHRGEPCRLFPGSCGRWRSPPPRSRR